MNEPTDGTGDLLEGVLPGPLSELLSEIPWNLLAR